MNSRRRVNSAVRRLFAIRVVMMKRLVVLLGILAILATSAVGQLRLEGPSWNGVIKRGSVRVGRGGSVWSVNGVRVSHTQELYESTEVARYILSRLKGEMHPASELAPNAGSVQFKVTLKRNGTRIAWVCGNGLHYIDAKLYSTALAFLGVWGFDHC
jgi:hypothetical protein